jgi:dihydrolipoamide dehydrogenase
MIAEVVVARKLETTAHEIIKAVHPHPTISESIKEALPLLMRRGALYGH